MLTGHFKAWKEAVSTNILSRIMCINCSQQSIMQNKARMFYFEKTKYDFKSFKALLFK